MERTVAVDNMVAVVSVVFGCKTEFGNYVEDKKAILEKVTISKDGKVVASLSRHELMTKVGPNNRPKLIAALDELRAELTGKVQSVTNPAKDYDAHCDAMSKAMSY